MSAALIASARAMTPLSVNDLKRSVDPGYEATW
jgi:hypothetical protein